MASITIELPDSYLKALQELADTYGIPLEVLLRSSLDSWISSQNADFVSTTDYVLEKNAELYQRLA